MSTACNSSSSYSSALATKKSGIKLIIKRLVDDSIMNTRSSTKRKRKDKIIENPSPYLKTRSCKKQQVKHESEIIKSPRKSVKRDKTRNDQSQRDTSNESYNESFVISLPDSSSQQDENSPIRSNLQADHSASEICDNLADLKINLFSQDDSFEIDKDSFELPDHYDYSDVDLKENVFYGYEKQKETLHHLIKNAILEGESSSVLVYGGPGSGKTSFIKTVLNESEFAKGCRILRLDGNRHGNDIYTIHYISKFLDSKVTDLPRIVDQFKKECHYKNANLIVVLEKFDEFCDHKNQYLLYNLFDLINYVSHMFVIGVSTRYDCIELLEKRVKSRMNHQIIDLKPPFQTLGEYLMFARKLLTKEDVPFTKSFQQNLEIQFSKSYGIAQLKACLFSNMFFKKTHRKVNRGPIKRVLEGQDEKVDLICDCLSNLEISILLLAGKLVYLKNLDQFNCNDLLDVSMEIPSQIWNKRDPKMMSSVVGALIEYDLFVKDEKKSFQNRNLWPTGWTPLALNVFRFQIEEALKRLENKIPTGCAQLFTF